MLEGPYKTHGWPPYYTVGQAEADAFIAKVVAVVRCIDDVEFAQDSLRHTEEVAALRDALGLEAPWTKRQ